MIISGAASVDATITPQYAPWVVAVTPVIVFALLGLLFWVCLRSAGRIVAVIGQSGVEAISRVMGFCWCAWACNSSSTASWKLWVFMPVAKRAVRRAAAMVGRVLLTLLLAASALWGCLALAYQAPGGNWGKGAAGVAWTALCVVAMVAVWRAAPWRRRAGWAYVVGLALLCAWWQTLAPSNDRIWADDVARMLRGSVQGSVVTLQNVRNFDWRADDDYTVRWETRQYDLDQLVSVDMALSYWDGPAIAHTLVSFGFADGRHVVFSVEIRKERGEQFSEIGGFFKQFELSVVAAEERDILYVRAGPRGENVYLYPVHMPRTPCAGCSCPTWTRPTP